MEGLPAVFGALSVTEEVTQARTDDLWRTIKLVGQTGQADKVEGLLGVFLISQVFRYGNCRLAVASPKDSALVNPSDFEGKKIATSYPYLTKRFFEDQGISIEMVEISGAVEITPQLHVADAISDLVSTGGTLKANGLVERFTLLESETKLIQTQQALSEGKQQLIQKFLQRIDGYQTAKKSRYILMNAPLDSVETIKALLPSMKSPTIMPLAETEMVAIHSVIPFDQFWDVMEQLQDAGASDIVMLPIESMIA